MSRLPAGTHYLRSMNNRCHQWNNPKRRRDLGIGPANPTEEGLASLHSVIFRKEPCLWRAALLYYATSQAARMSFKELFADLGKFVDCPNVRWDYCLRAKRGQTDTSQPGESTDSFFFLQYKYLSEQVNRP